MLQRKEGRSLYLPPYLLPCLVMVRTHEWRLIGFILRHSKTHSRMPPRCMATGKRPGEGDFVSAREDDLDAIATQERELCFPRFDEEMAWSVGSRLRTMAVARRAVAVIDIRRFGQPLFYCALPGTSPDNAEWVRRKSNLVARFHRSSYGLGIELGAHLFEKYALPVSDYAAHGGSFPICVQGSGVIGSITVSPALVTRRAPRCAGSRW